MPGAEGFLRTFGKGLNPEERGFWAKIWERTVLPSREPRAPEPTTPARRTRRLVRQRMAKASRRRNRAGANRARAVRYSTPHASQWHRRQG